MDRRQHCLIKNNIMNTFKQSAIEILKKTGKPLHYGEITKLALESGILETEGATPEATMGAQMIMEEKIVIEGGYIGKGGEHLVCSEMLFRGFNASIMSVDVGVDISAIKENKFFGVQVKTARKNSFNTYSFHIRKKSFDRFNQGNIFYILVLRDGLKNSFLIRNVCHRSC